jgi:hypothetical protein
MGAKHPIDTTFIIITEVTLITRHSKEIKLQHGLVTLHYRGDPKAESKT